MAIISSRSDVHCVRCRQSGSKPPRTNKHIVDWSSRKAVALEESTEYHEALCDLLVNSAGRLAREETNRAFIRHAGSLDRSIQIALCYLRALFPPSCFYRRYDFCICSFNALVMLAE
jgi:hypothetical protein